MKSTVIRVISLLFFFLFPLSALHAQSLEALLDTLDHTIDSYDEYASTKEARILALRNQLKTKQHPSDRYAVQTLLYDEYYVYDADSAMSICNSQLKIAEQLGHPDWAAEWHIKRSFIFAATGLLDESEKELASIPRPFPESWNNNNRQNDVLLTEYYRQRIYVYSHMQQYCGTVGPSNPAAVAMNERSSTLEQLYNDSILSLVPKTDPLYLWQMAWGPKAAQVKGKLVEALASSHLDNRFDAMNAYSLAHIYDTEGDQENRLALLAKSAIADIRFCNRDIASLEELARLLFERGDLERSYRYINYCLLNNQVFHNRVRMVSTNEIFTQIHQANLAKQHRQQYWLILAVITVTILAAALAAFILLLILRVRRTHRDELALAEANKQLEAANSQLSSAMGQVENANSELSALNDQLSSKNDELRESNYVKEETVGLAFSICSSYVTKMEEQRKTLGRLVITNQYDLLKKQLETSQSAAVLKEFFHHFDQLFLNIYPDFIEDFNSLLRPGEAIHPKETELLNTELRIYALVRLGINDSVKIADFLHCSPQTVYNHRLRVRNKSDIPNSDFAATVQRLGKASV